MRRNAHFWTLPADLCRVGSTNAGAIVGKYSQNPAGIHAVRTAITELNCPVEFVLLVEERAIVIAAVGPSALQPRSQIAAERSILAGDSIAQANGRTAGKVLLADGWTAALSAQDRLTADGEARLTAICAELSETLVAGACVSQTEDHDLSSRILNGMRDTVVVLSPTFDVAWANDAIATLLGLTPKEIIGRSAMDLVHPDDLMIALEAAGNLSDANRVYRINVRMSDALGAWVPVSISGVDHSADPNINGIVLSIRNDEREYETERTLEETRRVSSTILQSLTDAVVATDEAGQITIVNKAARDLFSIDASTPISTLVYHDFVLLDEQGEPIAAEDHPLNALDYWNDIELRVVSSAGIRNVTVSRSEVSSELDHLGTVVTFHDITQARSDARELRKRARHDQLTGLANRRYLQERLRMLENSANPPTLAACFVDIDKFKNVNDVHGHNVGDAVLKATAQRLSNQIRGVDILARPGGDEFLIVLVDPENVQAAVEVAERIRDALARPFDVDGLRLHLTASVGVAMHSEGCFDEERIMQRADIALYAAKERGRDRVEVFDQTLATVVEVEQLQRDLVLGALENDRLAMHFQPIVNEGGHPIGVEALARCIDESGAVIEPSGFLDAIDDTSLIVRLDHQGFRQTCALAATLAKNPATAHLFVSANFSAMTIAQSGFADMVIRTIEDAGAPPNAICIEVTETAAFQAGTRSTNALRELHDAGMRIVLDDFGTGYSSLSHLRDLPLSSVKIDRSFTSALSQHGPERAIASAVKELAESMGFNVVAEGVETAEDRQAVSEIGVTAMQGWYFARALSVDVLLTSLEQHSLIPC